MHTSEADIQDRTLKHTKKPLLGNLWLLPPAHFTKLSQLAISGMLILLCKPCKICMANCASNTISITVKKPLSLLLMQCYICTVK